MRRHSWKPVTLPDLSNPADRCAHCDTERTRDESTKSLYAFRGGRATHNHKPVPAGRWTFFVSGVIPLCVER